MANEDVLRNTYTHIQVTALGGYWAIAVAVATDTQGAKKIRVAKGKYAGIKPLNKGEITTIEGPTQDFPITQGLKMNLKRRSEWEHIKQTVDAYFDGGALDDDEEE